MVVMRSIFKFKEEKLMVALRPAIYRGLLGRFNCLKKSGLPKKLNFLFKLSPKHVFQNVSGKTIYLFGLTTVSIKDQAEPGLGECMFSTFHDTFTFPVFSIVLSPSICLFSGFPLPS